ncbi:MAG: hypothetical protein CSA05_03540 [Bacteroidia bacterium]|nr:MAG: hypothetical protein CSA05_03540 [Bacteroidia bacterium]
MKKFIFFSAIALLIFATMSCEKDEQNNEKQKALVADTYRAKGYVLFIAGACRGNGVYIEVVSPKPIGKEGHARYYSSGEKRWNEVHYKNAILVPHFYKVNLPFELSKEGTFLDFEYREYKDPADWHFFESSSFCTMDQIPSPATTCIITKIISHKSPKE